MTQTAPDKLEVTDLKALLGGKTILTNVTFRLRQGRIGGLLGPSGCGKTTLLRTIAGFEQPHSGTVKIDGHCAGSAQWQTPVEARNIGMVFQDFALFPHLRVRENITFGLRKSPPRAKLARADEVARLLDIVDLHDRYPHQLSGGQQQRVAIARAIAPRPALLLLDEPFSNMDVVLREQLARQLGRLLREDGMTTIMVTHNQLEAFAMADEIGVMQDGRLLQWDTAFNLYHRPVSAEVADFIGEGALLAATASDEFAVATELGVLRGQQPHGLAPGARAQVLLRPDDLLHDNSSDRTARIEDKVFRGTRFLYTLRLASGARVLSLIASHHEPGEEIGLRARTDRLLVFEHAPPLMPGP